MPKPNITIHLAESTSELLTPKFHKEHLDNKIVFLYPENGKSAFQIQQFVGEISLKTKPTAIVTDSLFLLREVYLAKIPIIWKNWNLTDNTCQTSACVDDLQNIHILDRELEQADRYLSA